MTFHCLVIENLDHAVTVKDISDFIYHHTSVQCAAVIMPGPSAQGYARAAIFMESQTCYKNLAAFLEDPNRIIVSASGRPFVVVDHQYGTPTAICGSLGLDGKEIRNRLKHKQVPNEEAPEGLKLVYEGTTEYTKALAKRDLFMEFQNHTEGLNKSLERAINVGSSSQSRSKSRE